MFPASLLVLVIKGTRPAELYFTEDYLFYEIMLVLLGLFVIGFLVGGKEDNKGNRPDY